jgi:ABC-type transport system involved in cytochrome c biogenesis permease subunit
VNLEQFRVIAVQHDGRFKTFDTLARSIVKQVSGDSEFERRLPGQQGTVKQDPAYTYLDLLFNAQAYKDLRLIHIRKKPIRDTLTQAALGKVDKDTLNAILKDGRVSLTFLGLPEVTAALKELSRDVMRSAKDVEALTNVAALADPRALARLLRVIPPPGARTQQERWFSIEDLAVAAAQQNSAGTGMSALPGMTPEMQAGLTDQWLALRRAWASSDAPAVNAALDRLANALRQANPSVYPAQGKLGLEQWYYRWNKMMWTWSVYLVALVLLLMGVVYRWRGAVRAGVGVFALAFALHTVAGGIRWYLAGRIPNSNMFEAVTAAAWFGGVLAIFLELGPSLYRRRVAWWSAAIAAVGGLLTWLMLLTWRGIAYGAWQQWGAAPIAALVVCALGVLGLLALAGARRTVSVRGVPLLAAAGAGMVALMCGQFLKNSLDSDIGRIMPVLSDLWLYVHTNMVIASYALIGMAFLTAAIYVVGRMLAAGPTKAPGLWLSLAIPLVVLPLAALFPAIELQTVASAWSPFVIVFGMYAVANVARVVWREGARRAQVAWALGGMTAVASHSGGALALAAGDSNVASGNAVRTTSGGAIAERPARGPKLATETSGNLAQVLDGATMLLLELSFITLWTGIIMGAIWADHSWGRPWGWDPKEVFALNTWIIFLILVHVRLKVRDKALWTGVLAVIGTSVMLFNWVVVNFFIVGLHSYA